MDQHQELEVDVEGEPTDQRKEEAADADAGKPEEPTDQRKEEEEEREEGDNLKEPTDQRKEDKPDGLTEQHKAEAVAVAVVVAEVDKSEELTDQRKAGAVVEVEVDKFEELTDQRKEEAAEDKDKETERSSSEESPSLFVHPCSLLLRYLVRAYAWCMGMADWFGGGGTRPSAAPAASLNSSREEAGEAAGVRTREISSSKTTDRGFYVREMIVSMWAVRRPRPPGNPREGRGGGGGSHN
ncbi:uncharacterized protein LOC119356907 [Triticum dicoccoides]|uniref:uncharacterized protein LOC119356907 n=1 Tax=Triticum dicoccoides TaxID=85692 RepID=UPI00188FB340|nr:uncharacterized protein LOC119356907 [Triticum dicoccoides]